MDADRNHEKVDPSELPLNVIAHAVHMAWNLREWVRECVSDRTLRPVLDCLLPRIKAKFELELLDANLAGIACQLPQNEGLTALQLIAFVEGLRFTGGERIVIPLGEPLLKWQSLSRARSLRLALQLSDKQGQQLYDPKNPDDLKQLESLDPLVLAKLWKACESVQAGSSMASPSRSLAENSPRRKRSTTPGSAQLKLISALQSHHQYTNGWCTNLEPVGNNELARLAGVDRASASLFFKKHFRGYEEYMAVCRLNPRNLSLILGILSGEIAKRGVSTYGGNAID